MNRRTFLKAAAVLPATARVLQSVAASASTGSGRIAAGLGMVEGEASLEKKFLLLKRAGFAGVELDSPNEWDRQEVLAARDRSGLVIHGVVNSVHWKHPLSDPDAMVREKSLEGLRLAIADAKAYGASTVLLVPAVVTKTVAYDEAYRRSQEEIRKAIPWAEKAGVRIAVENVWNQFLLSPLEMASYVDSFNSPWVGVYFDAGNIVTYGWPEQWIRILGKRILKVHVKGFSRTKRDQEGLWKGFDVEIGDDENDWPAVRAALASIGYDGWITAEVQGGGESRLRDVAQRLERNLIG